MPDEVVQPARSLHRKLAQIMYEAERIPKRGKAPVAMGGYPFVQVGDAADYIRKALGAALITMLPTKVTVVGQVDRPTAKGGMMTTVDLVTDWTFTDGESGESITIQSFGAGADVGDKYSGKASTSAMKYALLTAFLLSTGEDSELGATNERPANDVYGIGNPPPAALERVDGGLIGTLEARKPPADLELRQTPTGMAVGFGLVGTGGKGRVQVMAADPLATALHPFLRGLVGQRVQVFGKVELVPWEGKPGATWQRLTLERIATDEFTLPAELEAPSLPLFSEDVPNPNAGGPVLFDAEQERELDALIP